MSTHDPRSTQERLPQSIAEQLPIVLVGMPGSGKTTVGRRLAARLGLPHVDTDHLIEEAAGRSVSEIFAQEGEEGFREREAQAVASAVTMRAVVSLGGGAVTTPAVRQTLAGHTVVFVDVEFDELLARVSRKNTRPLLREDPKGTLQRLDAERRPFFEQVQTHTVISDSGPVHGVVAQVLDELSGTVRVTVNGEAPYDVVLHATDIPAEIAMVLKADTQRLLMVHSAGVACYTRQIGQGLEALGYAISYMEHPDGEAAKTVEVLAHGWDYAAQAGISRRDAIIGVGGGATTDVAGFIASTWLRGVDIIQIPTTVLAMVDAAVGGKTGINTPAGKNLAGAFHPPVGVIEDIAVLTSLPEAERVAGLGEVIKCGLIRDPRILDLARNAPEALGDIYSEAFAQAIEHSVRVKAQVVGADLKESGLREILNYGHTLAHGIEKAEDYRWRHGEAVAVGCVFAAELAYDRGLLSAEEVTLHREVFHAVGLPTSYSGATLDTLTQIMFSDKKVRSGQLRFVLLDGIGNPITVPVSPEELAGPAQRVGIHV